MKTMVLVTACILILYNACVLNDGIFVLKKNHRFLETTNSRSKKFPHLAQKNTFHRDCIKIMHKLYSPPNLNF
jgi:hypothetical protein